MTHTNMTHLSDEMETKIENIWVPDSFETSKELIRIMCPAGPAESKIDFDISLSSAPLSQIRGMTHLPWLILSNILPADNNDDMIEETVLLIIQLQNGTVVFDRLQRSNFLILGLRTARLSNKTAAQIFGSSNIKGIVSHHIWTLLWLIDYE